MQAGVLSARPARARHRHELRTLTYVSLDQANGGVIRNLTHDGIAMQAVAPVQHGQQLRVRFELANPRLRVETHGEVIWTTAKGQCGIHFLELSPRLARQIDAWIFGDLLDGIPTQSQPIGSIFSEFESTQMPLPEPLARFPRVQPPAIVAAKIEDDGLIIAGAARNVFELPPLEIRQPQSRISTFPRKKQSEEKSATEVMSPAQFDWLSQPLSGRTLIWTVNTLVVVAALLLFAVVFLSVTREPPKWPLTMALGAVALVTAVYWGFFQVFGGSSLGARLAKLAGSETENGGEDDARFR
jgi:PilZ domain